MDRQVTRQQKAIAVLVLFVRIPAGLLMLLAFLSSSWVSFTLALIAWVLTHIGLHTAFSEEE
jgi:fatty acid desaturase